MVLASTYPRWKDDPEPGFVHELCRRLTAQFQVVAVVPDAPGADASGMLDGVEVVRYRYAPRALQTLVNDGGIVANLKRSRWKWLLLPGFVLGQWWAMRRVMRRRHVDLIHAHWLLPQGLVATTAGVPFVVTSHGGDLFGLKGKITTRLKRYVASRSASMTVVSSAMAEEAQRIELSPPQMQVIPMGADLAGRFQELPSTERVPDQLLFVGRLVAKKGVIHLIEAMPQIVQARPAAHLKIVGFGPEESALKARLHQLGLSSRVEFVGAVPQKSLPEFYSQASVFVAPFVRDASGDQEGLPVALMEAVGCGCPAVAGDVPGVRDLMGEAADEFCVDGHDSAAIAVAAVQALTHPAEARTLAAAIRERAFDRVDWGSVARRYGDVLSASINRDRSS